MATSQPFPSISLTQNEEGKVLNRHNSVVEPNLLQLADHLQEFNVLDDDSLSTHNDGQRTFSKSLPNLVESCNNGRFCYANEETFQVKEATIRKICSVFDGIQLNEDDETHSKENKKDSYTLRWHYPLLDPGRREKEKKKSTRPAGKLRKFLRKVGLKSSGRKAVKRKPKTKII